MDLRAQRAVDNYVGRIAIAILRPTTMLLGHILRRDHRLTVGREVVWIKMLGGGSLLLAMPSLLGFRKAYPDVKMVLITTPAVKPFADLMGVFDEYRIIDPGHGTWRAMRSAASALAGTFRADCIIDLEVHSRLTTVFTTISMARNRVSFWVEDIFWRRGLASHLVFFNRASGSYAFYDRLAELFGYRVASREECRAAMLAACGAEPDAPVLDQVCVGFACSDLGRERMLNPAQWVAVFQQHRRPEQRAFVFLGAPGDRAQGEAIISALREAFPDLRLENRCGEMSLRESCALLARSREFWGIDSGLLHQARIAGLKCLSFWGPTDPSTRLRTDWLLDETIVYRKIACSPCVHSSVDPPCRGDNRCIQGLFDPARAPLGWTPIDHPPARPA